MSKFVYLFSEGNADMRELLGGKGANLAEMTNIGLPVPQGFTVTTEACNEYYRNNRTLSRKLSIRFSTLCISSKKCPVKNLVMSIIRSLYRFAVARGLRCQE